MACTTLALSHTVGALDYDYLMLKVMNHITVRKLLYGIHLGYSLNM